MYRFLFILLFSAAAFSAKGQATVSGVVRDSITHYPIVNATISNSSKRISAKTDENGYFRIRVNPDEVLFAVAKGYKYDTLRYSILFGDTLAIFMTPVEDMMQNVTVRAQYSRYQLDSMERRHTFEEARGTAQKAVGGPATGSGFGVSISMDRIFKKKYKNQEKQEELFRKSEETAYINYRFSPQMVASHTGLKDRELRLFMYRYTPSYEWLRANTSSDAILYYLNDKLKEFRAGSR